MEMSKQGGSAALLFWGIVPGDDGTEGTEPAPTTGTAHKKNKTKHGSNTHQRPQSKSRLFTGLFNPEHPTNYRPDKAKQSSKNNTPTNAQIPDAKADNQ